MTEDAKLTFLREEVSRIANIPSVSLDVPLMELGIESLHYTEIFLVCEQLYEVELDPETLTLDEYTTLRRLAAQVQTVKEARSH